MPRARRPSDGPEAVERHIATWHARCPPELQRRFVEEICGRTWTGKMTIGRAFGIVSTNYVRHEMTDYDRLRRIAGMTRDEARAIVAEEVKAIISSWATETRRKRIVRRAQHLSQRAQHDQP